MIKTTLAIAAAACFGLVAAVGAERGNSSGTGSKHPSSAHRASTHASRGDKTPSNRSPGSSSARRHGDHRSSSETHRNPDHQRRTGNRETKRVDDDIIQPDANVEVELPDRENGSDSENGADSDDQTSILFGGASDNDRGPQP